MDKSKNDRNRKNEEMQKHAKPPGGSPQQDGGIRSNAEPRNAPNEPAPTDKNPQDETSYPGYPHYPKKEDIYKNDDKESLKGQREDRRPQNPGDELDVPGSELDDADESIGEEDEENNYYSLGGDNHEDLEEPEE